MDRFNELEERINELKAKVAALGQRIEENVKLTVELKEQTEQTLKEWRSESEQL